MCKITQILYDNLSTQRMWSFKVDVQKKAKTQLK